MRRGRHRAQPDAADAARRPSGAAPRAPARACTVRRRRRRGSRRSRRRVRAVAAVRCARVTAMAAESASSRQNSATSTRRSGGSRSAADSAIGSAMARYARPSSTTSTATSAPGARPSTSASSTTGHVDRDPVADQHRVVLRDHHADHLPAPVDRRGDLPGGDLEVRMSRRPRRRRDRRPRRRLRSASRTCCPTPYPAPGRGARVGPAQTAHRATTARTRAVSARSRCRRAAARTAAVRRRATSGVDLDPVQQRRRTTQRFRDPLASSGGRLTVRERRDGAVLHPGQQDLGGVVADVDSGDDRATVNAADRGGRRRRRPARTSAAQRGAPRRDQRRPQLLEFGGRGPVRAQRLVQRHHLLVVDGRQFGCAQEVLGELWVPARLGHRGLMRQRRGIHPQIAPGRACRRRRCRR